MWIRLRETRASRGFLTRKSLSFSKLWILSELNSRHHAFISGINHMNYEGHKQHLLTGVERTNVKKSFLGLFLSLLPGHLKVTGSRKPARIPAYSSFGAI